MFNVPIKKIKKGNPEYALRAKGKVAELALGYQGGTGALIQMGALRMGLTEEELPDIVHRWRTANKRIQDFWYTVENCAIETVTLGTTNQIQHGGKLVENIVQAVARDLLANAIRNMLFGGYLINFHIHDEIIAEVPKGSDLTLEKAIDLMCRAPEWAEGLPLNADGFTGDFYKKE